MNDVKFRMSVSMDEENKQFVLEIIDVKLDKPVGRLIRSIEEMEHFLNDMNLKLNYLKSL